jgi:saccharopine dehydrogenase-like NADP-dependent oxidoreductase
MGTEATRDLAATSRFEKIVIADADEAKAAELARSLENPRVSARKADASDEASLTQLMRGFPVVLNCTSYKFGLTVTRAALAAKTNLLDLGGLYNTPKQLAMAEEAKAAGVTIVLGCGATPGVTNLMAKSASTHMDAAEDIEIAFASFRTIAPSPGLLDTVLDEFSPGTVRFYFEDGKLIEVPPFHGRKEIEFAAPVGRIAAYMVPHSETHTLHRFLPGVRKVSVRGTWRAETMEALRTFNSFDLLSEEPMKQSGRTPKSLLRELILERLTGVDEQEWAFLLNVSVKGRKGDRAVHATYNLSHPPRSQWGATATAKITGIPASIGAQLLAAGGDYPKGVVAPEACFQPEPFFAELAKRDIHVHEQIVSTRSV